MKVCVEFRGDNTDERNEKREWGRGTLLLFPIAETCSILGDGPKGQVPRYESRYMGVIGSGQDILSWR